MGVIVFAGPSLPGQERIEDARIDYRGPAVCGDIAHAVQAGARTIGLIDGRFETALPPWHKEILWAMAQGARVFGAASMGALRAAELQRFGMVGVGAVFEAFADGTLTDDDEVAVLHGPAELGHLAVTEAMVNVRWTAAAAASQGVISPHDAAAVVGCGKALFYKERSWEAIWHAVARIRPPDDVPALARQVLRHHLDIKRRDARLLLERILDPVSDGAIPAPPFVDTLFWQRMLDRLQPPTC